MTLEGLSARVGSRRPWLPTLSVRQRRSGVDDTARGAKRALTTPCGDTSTMKLLLRATTSRVSACT